MQNIIFAWVGILAILINFAFNTNPLPHRPEKLTNYRPVKA